MIQIFAQGRRLPESRRAAALLLAVLLNLALIPCSMAIEVVDEGHDCCPPELQLEALECCELDDVNVASRDVNAEQDRTPHLDGAPPVTLVTLTVHRAALSLTATGPPDPAAPSVALHKQHCVYLK